MFLPEMTLKLNKVLERLHLLVVLVAEPAEDVEVVQPAAWVGPQVTEDLLLPADPSEVAGLTLGPGKC